jgi:hypothetical protein
MKKFLIVLIALSLGVVFLHQKKFSVIPAYKIPKLLSSMRAKEFCTCYFLLGKGEDYCLKVVLKGYPKFEYSFKEGAENSVTFKNPVAESVAKVVSKNLGCQLIK